MAIAPVVIEFLAKGMPQVQQAFKSIHDAAIRAEQAQVRTIEKASGERKVKLSQRAREEGRIQRQAMQEAQKIADKAANDAVKSADKAEEDRLKARQKWWKKALKEIDKQVDAEAKLRKEAEKEVNKELDKAAKDRQKKREAEAKASADAAKKAAKDQYQANKDRIDRTKQAEKDLNTWQKSIQADRKREASEAKRLADEQKRDEEKRAREMQRINRSRGRMVEAVVGAGARGVISGLQRSASISTNLAGTAMQLGGGFSISDAVMREQNMRKEAAILSASTVLSGAGPGSEHGRTFTTDEVLSKAKAVGIAQNIDPSEVLRGFDEIKKLSGNLEKAVQVMPSVAKLATATGSDLSTTSKLAGNIIAANPNISAEDLDRQLRIFTKQGTVGGVEIEDFARYGNRITAGASVYGGDKETNEATLGALAQIARQYGSASGPAEAALGAQRFGTDVIKHADDLKAQGIEVSDGKGTIRDAQSIILEMLRKSEGDVLKLAGMGLGERGVRPLEGAAAIYRNAGGGEAGIKAVQAEFAKYTKGVSKKEIEEANKRVLAEQKVEQQMQELRIAMGEQLLPTFKDMIPALKDLLPALVDVARIGIPAFTELMNTVAEFVKSNKGIIESISAHPVGALIAFELTKSFASAGLPALLRSLIEGAFNGSKPPIPGVVGAGVTGAELGLIGVAAAIQGGALYDNISGVSGALDSGDERARKVSKMSPAEAAREIQRARGLTGGGAMGAAWGERLMTGINAVVGGPGAIIGQYAGDYASKAMTGQSVSERSLETISASRMLDVLERIASNTGRNAAGAAGNSGSNGAGRSESIINR